MKKKHWEWMSSPCTLAPLWATLTGLGCCSVTLAFLYPSCPDKWDDCSGRNFPEGQGTLQWDASTDSSHPRILWTPQKLHLAVSSFGKTALNGTVWASRHGEANNTWVSGFCRVLSNDEVTSVWPTGCWWDPRSALERREDSDPEPPTIPQARKPPWEATDSLSLPAQGPL